MMSTSAQVFAQALRLSSVERAELAEQLWTSLEFSSRNGRVSLWAKEVEDRINAYDRGKIKAIPAGEVFEKINRQQQS